MSQTEHEHAPPVPEGPTVCYAHTDTPTGLRCSRCGRPICGRCAIPASVGQHCPECVAEARKSTRKVSPAMRAAAPVVVGLVAVNVVVFLGQRLVPGLTADFAAVPSEIADGEWWRLLTAMFLHSPTFIFHILFNMLVLWVYGPQVEQRFGTARFLALYFIAGFVASASSYAFGSGAASLGASGAIFGVVGILLALFYNRRDSAMVRDSMRGLLTFVGINLAIGFIAPGIDYIAHIGGLAAGVLLGVGFDRVRGRGAFGVQIATAAVMIAIGIVLVAVKTSSTTTFV